MEMWNWKVKTLSITQFTVFIEVKKGRFYVLAWLTRDSRGEKLANCPARLGAARRSAGNICSYRPPEASLTPESVLIETFLIPGKTFNNVVLCSFIPKKPKLTTNQELKDKQIKASRLVVKGTVVSARDSSLESCKLVAKINVRCPPPLSSPGLQRRIKWCY